MMRWRMQRGQVSVCQRRRNGRKPHAEVWRVKSIRGATLRRMARSVISLIRTQTIVGQIKVQMMGISLLLLLVCYPPNTYGLYDMAGNVWEWCLDAYDANFYRNPVHRNPIAGAASISDVINNYTNVKSIRVCRGGSWYYFAQNVRVAYRNQERSDAWVRLQRFSLCEDCNTLTYFTYLPLVPPICVADWLP